MKKGVDKFAAIKYARELEKKIVLNKKREKEVKKRIEEIKDEIKEYRGIKGITALRNKVKNLETAVSKRDSKSAEKLLNECENLLKDIRVQYAETQIKKAEEYIREMKEIGLDVRHSLEILEEARKKMKDGDVKEVVRLAKKSQDEAGTIQETQVTDALSYAESLIESAENLGVDTKDFKKSVEEIKEIMARAEYSVALEEAVRLTNEIDIERRAFISSKMDEINRLMKDAKDEGKDISRIENVFIEAERVYNLKDYEMSIRLLRRCEEFLLRDKKMKNEIEENMEKIKENIKFMEERGIDISELSKEIDECNEKIENKELEEALIRSKKLLERTEREVCDVKICEEISEEIPDLLSNAAKMGVDIDEISSKFEDINKMMDEKKYDVCASELKKLKESIVEGQRNVIQDAIESIKMEIEGLKEENVKEVEGIEKKLSEAIENLEKDEMIEAYHKCQDCIENLDILRENYESLSNILLSISSNLTILKNMDVDVEDISNKVDKIKEDFGKVEIEDVLSRGKELLIETNEILSERVSSKIEEMKVIVDDLENVIGAPVIPVEMKVLSILNLWDKMDYKKFFEEMDVFQKYIEEYSKKYNEARDKIMEFQSKSSYLKIIGERDDDIQKIISECFTSLNSGHFDEVIEKTLKGSEMVSLRCRKYVEERLKEIREKVVDAEDRGVKPRETIDALRRCEEAYESRVYEISAYFACVAKEMSDKEIPLLSQFIDSKILVETLIATLSRFGVETSKIKEKMEDVEKLEREFQFEDSLELLTSLIDVLENKMRSFVEGAIETFKEDIMVCEGTGLDMSGATEKIKDAERLMDEGLYEEAYEKIQQHKKEVGMLREKIENSSEMFEKLTEVYTVAQEMDVLDKKIEDEFEKIDELFSSREFDDVIKRCTRLREEIEEKISSAIQERLLKIDDEIKAVEDMGVDASDMKEDMKKIDKKLNVEDYLSAHELCINLEKLLTKIKETYNETKNLTEKFDALNTIAQKYDLSIEHALDMRNLVDFSLEKGNYEEAMEFAKRSVEEISEEVKKKAKEELIEIERILEELKEREIPMREFDEKYENLSKSLEENDLLKVISGIQTLSADIYTLKERYENTLKTLEGCKSIIAAAKEQGVVVSDLEEKLQRCEKFMRLGKYEDVVEICEKSTAECENRLETYKRIREMIEMCRMELSDAEYLGCDITIASDLLQQTEIAMEHGEYDAASTAIEDCKNEIQAARRNFVEEVINSTQKQIDEGTSIGADVSSAMEILESAKTSLSVGDFIRAYEDARRALDAAETSTKMHMEVLEILSNLERDIIMARDKGINVADLMETLEISREILQRYDYERCKEMVEKSRREIEQRIERHKSVEEKLKRIYEMLEGAKSLRIDIDLSDIEKYIVEAKESFRRNMYDDVEKMISDIEKKILHIQSDKIMEEILNVEREIEDGEKMGLKFDEFKKVIYEAVTALDRYDFELAAELINDCKESITMQKKEGLKLLESLSNIRRTIEDYKVLNGDVGIVESILNDAFDALNTKDFDNVKVIKEELQNTLTDKIREDVEKYMNKMVEKIRKGEEEGVPMVLPKDRLRRAREAFDCDAYKTAIIMLDECSFFIEDNLKKYAEITERLNSILERIDCLKDMGISVASIMEKVKEAEGLAKDGEYEKCAALLSSIGKIIDNKSIETLEQQIKDFEKRIESIRELGCDSKMFEATLENVENLIKDKMFSEAHQKIISAKKEIDSYYEEVVSVKNILEHIEKEMKRASEMGIDVSDMKDAIEETKNLLSDGNLEDATEVATVLLTDIMSRETDYINSEISKRESRLRELEAKDIYTRNIIELIENIRSLLRKEEFIEAYNSLIKVDNAIDDAVKMHNTAKEKLKEIEVEIENTADMGADVSDAIEIIENMYDDLKLAEYENIERKIKLCKKLLKEAKEKVVEEGISGIMSLADEGRSIKANVSDVPSKIVSIRKLASRQEFEKALESIEVLMEELDKRIKTHKKYHEKIESADARIKDAEKDGLNVKSAKRQILSAKRYMRAYDYKKVEEYVEKCINEIEVITRQSKEARRIIAFCEERIENAKRIGANVSSVEKMLKNAKAAIETQNYVKAFQIGTTCLTELNKNQQSIVMGTIISVDSLIDSLGKIGVDIYSSRELLNIALEALTEGEFEKALELCRQSEEDALLQKEKYMKHYFRIIDWGGQIEKAKLLGVNTEFAEEMYKAAWASLEAYDYETINDMLEQIEEEISKELKVAVEERIEAAEYEEREIEEMGAATQIPRDRISRAKDAYESGEVLLALQYVEESLQASKESKERYLKIREEMRKISEQIEEAKSKNIETKKIESYMLEAETKLDEGNYEDTTYFITKSREELETTYRRTIQEKIAKLRTSTKEAKSMGMRTEEYEDIIKDCEEFLKSGDFDDALELADAAIEGIKSGINDYISREIEKVEKKIEEAQRMGADIENILKMIMNARKQLSDGKLESSIKTTHAANQMLTKILKDTVNTVISTFEGIIDSSVSMGINYDDSIKLLNEVKKLADEGNFEKAHTQALIGIAEVEKLREEKVSTEIKDFQLKMEEAEGMGCKIDDLNEILESAIEYLDSAEYEKSLSAVERGRKTLKAKLTHLVEEIIESSEKIIKNVIADVDITSARRMLEDAKVALKDEEYEEAIDYAQQSAIEAKRVQEEYIEKMILISKRKLEKYKEMGADIEIPLSMLEDAKKESIKQNWQEAVKIIKDAEKSGDDLIEEILKDAILYCKKVIESVSMKDKKLDGYIKNAEHCLKEKDYEKGHANIMKAVALTEDIQEKLVTDMITKVEAIISEGEEMGANMSSPHMKLEEALDKMEIRDFESAHESCEEAFKTANEIIEQFKDANKILNKCEEEVAKLVEIGLDVEEAADLLDMAHHEMKNSNYIKAKEIGETCVNLINQLYVKAASDAISTAQFKISYAKNIGADVKKAELLLNDARKKQEKGEYRDAYQLALQGRNEAENAKNRYKEIIDLTCVAESKILTAESYGVDVSEAKKYHRMAVNMRSKNAEEALAHAKKSLEIIEKSLEEFSPEISYEFKPDSTFSVNKWTTVVLILKNEGGAPAKEIKWKIEGDIDTQGPTSIPFLRKGGKREIKIRIKPKKSGDMPLNITVKYLREFDLKEYEKKDVRWVKVEEAAAPGAAHPQFVRKSVRCYICLGIIKSGLTVVKCECGKTYHETCASRVGECPNCGRTFKIT